MSVIRNAIQHIWVGFKYYFYKSTSYVSDKLPLRFTYWVGSLVGDLIYLVLKRHSANAVSNMRRVLGPDAPWQTVKHMARQSFRNYAKTMVDFLRFPHMNQTEINQAVPIRYGVEHLHAALKKGNGALVVSGHIGNWDLAGAVVLGMGLPLNAVADSYEPKRMDELINGTRERVGMNIIRVSTGSLRQIFTALKKNEVVVLLFDRPEAADQGVPVKFFGETAYVPAGPAAIALKTRATVLIGSCLRRPGNKTFYGAVEPAIDYEPYLTGDKEQDIKIITQIIVYKMEQIIRRHPDQWYMFREMWPRTEEDDEENRQKRFWGGKGNISMASS
jgi:lauroyl/myristoyl acyltransferase